MKDQTSHPVGGRYRGPLVAALVCVACLTPFVAKPFTIDDPLFVWAAQHVAEHPADPYGFEVNWYGYPMRMADLTKNPPLTCYFLALAGMALGWSEVVLHGVCLLPAVGAAWGTYRLAETLCGRPLLATLAAVLTPLFLVSSSNVMCDTMMLCFWVWALVCWRRGRERPGWLFVAGVLVSLSALSKYFGTCLIPLLVVDWWLRYRRESRPCRRFSLVVLLIPLVTLTAYQMWSSWTYQRGLLLDAFGFAVGSRSIYGAGWRSPMVGLAFAGGCMASVLFFLPLLRFGRRLWAFVLFPVPFLVLPLIGERGADGLFLIQAALYSLGGIAILALAVDDLRRRADADGWLLFLWTAGTLAFAIGVNWVINARSLLPLAPAVGILIARRLDYVNATIRWGEVWPLLPSAIVALLVTLADCQQAESERQAARRIAETCSQEKGKLWFEGHWGFQYYLRRAGGEEVDLEATPHFAKNDFLALPGNNYGVQESDIKSAEPFFTFEQASPLFAGTMNDDLGAGFYSQFHGPLPFVFGRTVPVRYRILRFREPFPGQSRPDK